MNRKSPHSIGLCHLSGPLPKKEEEEGEVEEQEVEVEEVNQLLYFSRFSWGK